MANKIQVRRGAAATWTANNPTLSSGEFGYETDTGRFKIGDGSSVWNALGFKGEGIIVKATTGLPAIGDENIGKVLINTFDNTVHVYTKGTTPASWALMWSVIPQDIQMALGLVYDIDVMAQHYANPLSSTAGAISIDCLAYTGRVFELTLTENITSITFTDVPASIFTTITLVVTQHASSAKTIALPSGGVWATGNAPDISGLGAKYILTYQTSDGGTSWLVSGTGLPSTPTISDGSITNAKLANMAAKTYKGRTTNSTGVPEDVSVANLRTDLSINNVDNTSDANKPVSSATQTALNAKEDSANKATDFSTVNNTLFPTVQATKTYADSLVAGLLDYRGAYDASVNTWPAAGGSGTAGAVMKGDMWVVSVAGTLGGNAIQIGDSIIANIDTPGQTAGNWNTLNTNLTYVPEDNANKVTSISGASTDTQYPSAKLVYDQLALKLGTSGTAAKSTNLVGGNATTLLGSTPYQSNTDTTTMLAPNTTTTKKFKTQTGDGTNGAAPVWSTILASDIPAASTSAQGAVVQATAPAAGLINVVGIGNGETAYTNKALFDATSPSTQALGDAAATGSATTSARRDHKHAMPSAAIASEVTTGTDTTKPVTADALAGSTIFGVKSVYVPLVGDTTDLDTTIIGYVHVPQCCNGMNLIRAQAYVITAGTTNATTFQVRNMTKYSSNDALSTAISIASGGTVGTPGTVNASYDDVSTDDLIKITVTANSTTKPKGGRVLLEYQLP